MDALREVIARFDLSAPVDWDRAAVFRGFSGAAVHRVPTADGEACAMRRWANRSLNVLRLRGLHRLLRHVYQSGISQVAVPLTANDGESFVRHDGHYWQLEPWLPGVADYWSNPSRERLCNAMEALAAWHDAAGGFDCRESERRWFGRQSAAPSPTVADRLAKIQRWRNGGIEAARAAGKDPRDFQKSLGSHAPEFVVLVSRIFAGFEAVAPRIQAELRRFETVPFRLQPCLRDIWHDHVLFTGDTVTGLIDATACRTANIATDLARLLGSLVSDNRADWEFALNCYTTHHPLAEAERDLAYALDRGAVVLSGLTWVDRVLLQRQPVADPEAVVARVRRIVERVEALAGSLTWPGQFM